jgi:hypothetical protein
MYRKSFGYSCIADIADKENKTDIADKADMADISESIGTVFSRRNIPV